MPSSLLQAIARTIPALEDRFERLRQTATLRGAALERWRQARVGVVGCGVLGSRFAPEAVRSGASVSVFDLDSGLPENLGTQVVEAGVPKAGSVARMCNAIAPGKAQGVVTDIRHVGIGILRGFDLLVDCTDDPDLAVFETEVSNGLDIPLLRLALDGTGEVELGRVLCSHGGAGHACQLCPYSVGDLARHLARSPCPGMPIEGPPPTRSGGAMGMAVAGLGLLQAQRLIGGNDIELALDREIVLDWSHFEILSLELSRSTACLSQHTKWELIELDRSASETTLSNLFDLAQSRLGTTGIVLEPFSHPLCLGAVCACGAARLAVGTVWALPPRCSRCGRGMSWRRDLKWPRLREDHARELGIHDNKLEALGLPSRGAMVTARSPEGNCVRFLLRCGLCEKTGRGVTHDQRFQ